MGADAQGGKMKSQSLHLKTDTWGKEGEQRMGKGSEDTALRGGERRSPARHRSLPIANLGVAAKAGQKSEDNY